MQAFVTGGAGFIGSHLVERLLKNGYQIVVYDNFSSGKKEYFSHIKLRKLTIIKDDVLNFKSLLKAMKGSDIIFHMSANADVRKGTIKTDIDLKQETIATYNVLEAMRVNHVKRIIFPSSMTVYGRARGTVSESYGPCLPISLYGAAKLSCEAMISAYCETFGMRAWIARFANVVGKRATHGVIYDLINKLVANPKVLRVLGDGNQNKPYIYIDDALDGVFFAFNKANDRVNVFNIGVSDTLRVKEIVYIIKNKMNLRDAKIKYDKTPYGWKGDVAEFRLDISKLRKLDFKLKYSTYEAIEMAVSDRLNEIGYA